MEDEDSSSREGLTPLTTVKVGIDFTFYRLLYYLVSRSMKNIEQIMASLPNINVMKNG